MRGAFAPGEERRCPAELGHAGANHPFTVPAALTGRVAALARRTGSTSFMVLLTAFAALLARWSGQSDVVIGSPVAGRDQPELSPLIGMFVNTLPLRTDLSGDPSFAEALERVRTTVIDALDHQDVPFARIVSELNPPRDPSRTPLYQIAFNQLPYDVRGQIGTGTTKTDLTLELQNAEGDLSGWLEYATDLYDPATIARLAEGFLALLDAATADPARPLSRLPLMPAGETGSSWHGPRSPYPALPLHELVAGRAAATPGAAAVVVPHEGRTLTYGELDERAGALARVLVSRGVRVESPVAVCLPPGGDLVVALLAVLKAGACLRAARPALSGRTAAFHAGGLRDRARPDHAGAGRTAARRARPDRPGAEPAGRSAAAPRLTRPPGLPHLHLRLHRASPRASWCRTGAWST